VVCCFLLFLDAWFGLGVCGVGGVGEVFVARVIADGKVTVPRRVRDVLGIEKGDYVRVTITEVIKERKQRQREKAGRRG